jgi:hypothetical protein
MIEGEAREFEETEWEMQPSSSQIKEHRSSKAK